MKDGCINVSAVMESLFKTSFYFESVDTELDDLVNCVSIGQTSLNRISGKCSCINSSSHTCGDFDPLKLPIASFDFNESEQETNHERKRTKLTLCVTPPLPDTCSKPDESFIDSESHTESQTRKLKRKRHLLDDEDFHLTTLYDKQNRTHVDIKSHSVCAEISNEHEKNDNLAQEVEDSFDIYANISASPHSCGSPHGGSKGVKSEDDVDKSIPDLDQLTLQEHEKKTGNRCSDVTMDENITCEGDMDLTEKIMETSENVCANYSMRKRIRKTLPPVKTRHTPLGLPKPLRLKKASFSVEEIYTNKNYSTPVPKTLETIFEYPKQERDGTMRFVEKRRKQRAMYFSTNPADRPTKKRGKHKAKKRVTRRNKTDNTIDAHTRLMSSLALLDQQLDDLSP